MLTVLRWSLFVGLVWIALIVALQGMILSFPEYEQSAREIQGWAINMGASLGRFIAPVLQLALIILIFISAAERLGLLTDTDIRGRFSSLITSPNIQAFIAIVIVVSLCIAALSNIGDVSTLKDLALVVVGFYFGSRRKEGEAIAHSTDSEDLRIEPSMASTPSSTSPPTASP